MYSEVDGRSAGFRLENSQGSSGGISEGLLNACSGLLRGSWGFAGAYLNDSYSSAMTKL